MLHDYLSISELTTLAQSPLAVEGVVIALPFTKGSEAQQAAKLMAQRANYPGRILAVHDEEGIGFNAIVNLVFSATNSTYFAYVAQDAFAGRDWLKLAVNALGEQKCLLGFNDGKWAGVLAGFGLARRSWAEKNYAGNFFCPEYHRHYADAEITLLAMQAGLYVYEPDSILVEVDWDKDRSSVDVSDKAIFLARKQHQFDGRVKALHLLNLIT